MAVIARLRGGEWFNFLSTHYPEMAEAVHTFYTKYYMKNIKIISDDDVEFCLLNYFHWKLSGHYGASRILTPEHRKMFDIAFNNSYNVLAELRRVFP